MMRSTEPAWPWLAVAVPAVLVALGALVQSSLVPASSVVPAFSLVEPYSLVPSSSRVPSSRVPAHPLLVQEAVLPVLVLLARPCVEAGRLEQSAHLRNDFLRRCRARHRARASRRWSDLALLRVHIPEDSWANAFLTCRLGQ